LQPKTSSATAVKATGQEDLNLDIAMSIEEIAKKAAAGDGRTTMDTSTGTKKGKSKTKVATKAASGTATNKTPKTSSVVKTKAKNDGKKNRVLLSESNDKNNRVLQLTPATASSTAAKKTDAAAKSEQTLMKKMSITDLKVKALGVMNEMMDGYKKLTEENKTFTKIAVIKKCAASVSKSSVKCMTPCSYNSMVMFSDPYGANPYHLFHSPCNKGSMKSLSSASSDLGVNSNPGIQATTTATAGQKTKLLTSSNNEIKVGQDNVGEKWQAWLVSKLDIKQIAEKAAAENSKTANKKSSKEDTGFVLRIGLISDGGRVQNVTEIKMDKEEVKEKVTQEKKQAKVMEKAVETVVKKSSEKITKDLQNLDKQVDNAIKKTKEAEAKKKAAELAKKKAAEEAKKKAELAKKKAAEDAKKKKAAEEAAKKKAAADAAAAKKKAAADAAAAKKKAAEEAARKRADEEAARKRAAEEAGL